MSTERASKAIDAADHVGRESNSDPAELGKFNRLADTWWDESGPLATLHAINPLRVDYIAARVPLDGARVLDVGCGAGILAEALAARGARVTAIDLAEENIRVARRHAEGRDLSIDYVVSSADEYAASQAGQFDVVTCLEVLEHVPRPEDTIASCAKALRPGGMAVFSTINRNFKSFALAIVAAEYVLGMVPRGTHSYLKLLKPSELARAARQAGLALIDLEGLHYNPVTRSYRLGGNVDVNYLAAMRRPESA